MPNSSPSSLESFIRLFFGFLLWGVSATLTFVLLVSLGDGTILGKALLGIVAVALEGSKILAWRKGGPSRVYALALIVLSGIASLGSSLQILERSQVAVLAIANADIHSSPIFLAQEGELASIDSEIAALVSRLKALPTDYSTAAIRTESSLAALRDRKQGILASLDPSVPTGISPIDRTMISILAQTVGLHPNTLLLVLLLFVSAAIEVGALLLTIPDREASPITAGASATVGAASQDAKTRPSLSHTPCITPDAFLEAAKDGADLPYLHGRDTTATRLSISSAEAKRLVWRLIEDGRIVVEGKRLRLVSESGPIEQLDSALSGSS